MNSNTKTDKIINYLINNKNFNIFNDKENINELIESLEPDRLDVLNIFLIKLNSQIKHDKNIKKINFTVALSDGDINNLELSLIFNEKNNFNQINASILKIYELKRHIDKNDMLWFINIGIKF